MSRISMHLVQVTRGKYVDCTHKGSIAVVSPNGQLIAHVGDPYCKVFMRSACKPFQALSLILSGAYERYSITEEELAVICSSHYGEECHLAAVQSVLNKIGATEDDLLCGADYSLKKEHKDQQIWSHLKPRNLYNDCSGKHSGMLAGLTIKDYNDPAHPLQKDIETNLLYMCKLDHIDYAIDGCTVPAFILPLYNFALGFARLANYGTIEDIKYREACKLIYESMRKYPYMVAGENGFCTELMKRNDHVVGKLGAEAVYGIGSQEKQLGFAVKMDDGNYERPLYPAVVETLEQLKVIKPGSLEDFRILANKNKINAEVGKIEPIFQLSHDYVQQQ